MLERGEWRERERNIGVREIDGSVAIAGKLGMCADRELNRDFLPWPSGAQDSVPTNWATLVRGTWMFRG